MTFAAEGDGWEVRIAYNEDRKKAWFLVYVNGVLKAWRVAGTVKRRIVERLMAHRARSKAFSGRPLSAAPVEARYPVKGDRLAFEVGHEASVVRGDICRAESFFRNLGVPSPAKVIIGSRAGYELASSVSKSEKGPPAAVESAKL